MIRVPVMSPRSADSGLDLPLPPRAARSGSACPSRPSAPRSPRSALPGELPVGPGAAPRVAKAEAVAARHPRRGRDRQRPGRRRGRKVLDKPGDAATCRSPAGRPQRHRRAQFHTGCAVIGPAGRLRWCTSIPRRCSSAPERRRRSSATWSARSRSIAPAGFKAEGLGITLFESIESQRPDRADRPAADLAGGRAAPGRVRAALGARSRVARR